MYMYIHTYVATYTLSMYTYLMIYRNLTKAAFILLPILGCTWIIGIMAVNENLIVFAWIFTVLNSLQVYNHVYIIWSWQSCDYTKDLIQKANMPTKHS